MAVTRVTQMTQISLPLHFKAMKILDLLKRIPDYQNYSNGEKLKRLVEESATLLQEKKIDFDTIGVMGVSGLLVAAPLAVVMGKELLVVRKSGDKRSRLDFGIPIALGIGRNQKILLLDDGIETGATIAAMISKIKSTCPNPTFAGLFLYCGKHSKPNFKFRCNDELLDVIRFPKEKQDNEDSNAQKSTHIVEQGDLNLGGMLLAALLRKTN
jgi:hypoxanthine phosphoribosyltransferase